jgi:uncharacterized membrane protein
MFGNDRGAAMAPEKDVQVPELPITRGGFEPDMADEKSSKIVKTFDDFMDRAPGWPFHLLGTVTALVALWFALAALGGLPRGVVEWIALAMLGAFAYGVGFLVPLLLAFLVDSSTRLSAVLMLVGGVALLAAMAVQGPV